MLRVFSPVVVNVALAGGTTSTFLSECRTILMVNVYSVAGSRSVNVTVYCIEGEVKLALIGPSSDGGSTVEMINSCSGWYSVRGRVMVMV